LLSTTAYYNDGTGGTNAIFFVADLCATDTVDNSYATVIDDAFVASYVRPDSAGRPAYLVEFFSTSLPAASTLVWHAMLYNYTLSQWELVAASIGRSSEDDGSITFQSSFGPGPCPQLPTIAATDIRVFNAQAGRWESLSPVLAGTTSYVINPDATAGCFRGDGTGPASYDFAVPVPNSAFTVSMRPRQAYEGIYVASGDSVKVYAANATGNAMPKRQIVGPSTMLRNPTGLAVDSTGALWVLNADDTVTAFAPGADNDARPLHTFTVRGPSPCPTTFAPPCTFAPVRLAVAPDGSSFSILGHIVASEYAVATFSTANGARQRIFYTTQAKSTNVPTAAGLAITDSGDIMVASTIFGKGHHPYNNVVVYSGTTSSTDVNVVSPPIRSEAGTAVPGSDDRPITGLTYRSGNYALSQSPLNTVAGPPVVSVFTEGAINTQLRKIEGPATLLDPRLFETPFSPFTIPVALGSDGTLFVGSSVPDQPGQPRFINAYAPGRTGDVAPTWRMFEAVSALAAGPSL
jgi:hypothetical protein